MTRAAQAAPDGYTIAVGNMGTQSAAPALYPNLKYDPATSFEQIGICNFTPQAIVAKKDTAAKDLKAFIDYLKANHQKLSYGHAGVGSISHVSGTLFNAQFGLKPALVAYRGTAPALNDLVGGQIDYMVDQSLNVIPQIKAGTIKAYAIAAPERLESLPRRADHQGAGRRFHLQRLERHGRAQGHAEGDRRQARRRARARRWTMPTIKERYVELGSTAPQGADRGPAGLQKLVESEMARITPVLKEAAAATEAERPRRRAGWAGRHAPDATKNAPCWRASRGPSASGPSATRSRSASSSTRPISCPSARRTSWPTPRAWARRASPGSRAWRRCPRPQRRVRIPTITDPRGLDFASYKRLKQTDAMAAIEARAIAAFEALGVLMTNTCINYQTILPPVRGEHLALGDTGVVIYSNSVMGARSNFEGGPSALAAGLTGRTPRYGYHLDAHRAGTMHFARQPPAARLRRLGRARRHRRPRRQQLLAGAGRHRARGACPTPTSSSTSARRWRASARWRMFHMPGVTPEAPTLADAFHGRAAPAGHAASARPTSRLSMRPTRRPATRSTWWCSPRRSCR